MQNACKQKRLESIIGRMRLRNVPFPETEYVNEKPDDRFRVSRLEWQLARVKQ